MYLKGTSRLDIPMVTHQATRFYNNPKLSHKRAVHRIGRYVKATHDKGIMFKPDGNSRMLCGCGFYKRLE